jgi:hypothetical protein
MFFSKGKKFDGGFGFKILEFHFPHAGRPMERSTGNTSIASGKV